MFILYAIPIGVLIGLVSGGRLDRLSELRLRWVPIMLLGLAVQIALFSDPVGSVVRDAGPASYVASTAAVFIAVLRNLATPGIWLIAVGAGCNLAAIVANGGSMPADRIAIGSVGGLPPSYTNSMIGTQRRRSSDRRSSRPPDTRPMRTPIGMAYRMNTDFQPAPVRPTRIAVSWSRWSSR